MTTFPAILDRINTIAASSPYSYTRAETPFSFDGQTGLTGHKSYRVTGAYESSDGNLGLTQIERWRVDLWLAHRDSRARQTAYRAMQTDVSSLTATVMREDLTQDFCVLDDGFESEVQDPPSNGEYVIGRVSFVVDFERAL